MTSDREVRLKQDINLKRMIEFGDQKNSLMLFIHRVRRSLLDPFLHNGRLVPIGLSWRAVCPKRLGAAKPCRNELLSSRDSARQEPEAANWTRVDCIAIISSIRYCEDRLIVPRDSAYFKPPPTSNWIFYAVCTTCFTKQSPPCPLVSGISCLSRSTLSTSRSLWLT